MDVDLQIEQASTAPLLDFYLFLDWYYSDLAIWCHQEHTSLRQLFYSAGVIFFFIILFHPLSALGQVINSSPIIFLNRRKTNWKWHLRCKCRRRPLYSNNKRLVLKHMKHSVCFCGNIFSKINLLLTFTFKSNLFRFNERNLTS